MGENQLGPHLHRREFFSLLTLTAVVKAMAADFDFVATASAVADFAQAGVTQVKVSPTTEYR